MNQNEIEELKNRISKLEHQIIQQEKLAMVGRLTAGILHEIQNPLNFVNNFAQLNIQLTQDMKTIIEEIEEQEDISESLEEFKEIAEMLEANSSKISEHGKRAQNIIKGMLLQTRGKDGAFQLTDINNMVEEYTKLAYHGMRASDSTFNTKTIYQLESNLPPVEIIPQDLSRAILNIVNNACYAVFVKSALNLENYSPEIKVTTENKGQNIQLTFRDNGIGIPERIREKIFLPFFSTKEAGKGTGLGLAMVREIIEKKHKGSITIDSKEGEFTQFTICLPIKKHV
jgi:signal transduction histidine kinase